MSERRGALDASVVQSSSEAIGRRVLALMGDARTAALYAAIRNEVDLAGLFDALRARGVVAAYPRVEPPSRLQFHRVDDLGDLQPAGRYRIPEPSPSAPAVEPGALDVIVVPGLAFDARGHRVGWGAGYYDALLQTTPHARRIGVCFDFQLVARCPSSASDQPVHVVVTEDRVVHTAPSQKETP